MHLSFINDGYNVLPIMIAFLFTICPAEDVLTLFRDIKNVCFN